jgi:prepilin-type N-terminal cleavage/methylation domain-containing protein
MNKKYGFTVMEVLVAIVILSLTSLAVLQFLYTFNNLYGRSTLLAQATAIARDEAETIKAKASQGTLPKEEEYAKAVGSRNFVIQRKIFDADSLNGLIANYTIKKIEIVVREERKPDGVLISVQFLQGYYIQ